MTPKQALANIATILQRPSTVYNGMGEAHAAADSLGVLRTLVEKSEPPPDKKRKPTNKKGG